MKHRRLFLVGMSLVGLGPCLLLAQPAPAEQKLRDRLRAYVQAWNRHDINAWSEYLTDDVWFTQAWDFYGRGKGREGAHALFKSNFAESELEQEIVQVKMMPDGTATVAMRETVSHLPKTDGKYKAVFKNDPVISRWRVEGNVWKMFFFTSHGGWAIDQLKKDGLQ